MACVWGHSRSAYGMASVAAWRLQKALQGEKALIVFSAPFQHWERDCEGEVRGVEGRGEEWRVKRQRVEWRGTEKS
ncbi:unnamed protein product [Gadus morhua 'NCC']